MRRPPLRQFHSVHDPAGGSKDPVVDADFSEEGARIVPSMSQLGVDHDGDISSLGAGEGQIDSNRSSKARVVDFGVELERLQNIANLFLAPRRLFALFIGGELCGASYFSQRLLGHNWVESAQLCSNVEEKIASASTK